MNIKNIGTESALRKIKHYCSYQERCHKEVREKLYSFGLYKTEVESLVSELIEGNYLNEERYAIAYAGGKFRQNKWGKAKISSQLYQSGVSKYCISKALKAIDHESYMLTLRKLYEAKYITFKSEKNNFIKISRVRSYLLQKGFETDLINIVSEEVKER